MPKIKPMGKKATIFVAGEDALIGAALRRRLEQTGYGNIVRLPDEDLTSADIVEAFFAEQKPEYVFMVAGRSGGIKANQTYPADLMLDNLLVECNAIAAAHRQGVKKLLYLASSCSYPRECPQPMKPESLLTGPLEPTNEAYAMAKLTGLKLCEAYRQQHGDRFVTAIAANAFGPGDDFDPEESHVIAALIRRMHEAKTLGRGRVDIWGTGLARRDFIYVDDLADACLLVMNEYESARPVNLGTGKGITVRELADIVKKTVGYEGELHFDVEKPDGMPVKVLDSSWLRAVGWQARVGIKEAVFRTYEWFLNTQDNRASKKRLGGRAFEK